jgi:hypothetical protein
MSKNWLKETFKDGHEFVVAFKVQDAEEAWRWVGYISDEKQKKELFHGCEVMEVDFWNTKKQFKEAVDLLRTLMKNMEYSISDIHEKIKPPKEEE